MAVVSGAASGSVFGLSRQMMDQNSDQSVDHRSCPTYCTHSTKPAAHFEALQEIFNPQYFACMNSVLLKLRKVDPCRKVEMFFFLLSHAPL
jgi:hypothetical protein